MKRLVILTALLAGLLANTAFADTLVLIQGYRGDAGSWHSTGIAQVLQQNNWQDAGHFSARSGTVRRWATNQTGNKTGKNCFYTIGLPTEAPITVQTRVLSDYLAQIKLLHGKEPIHLVGHSAGGVVARATMVTHPTRKINTLITIASPLPRYGRG